MSEKENISSIIIERTPEFIRLEYDKFVKFLQYYFQWLESDGNFIRELLDFENKTEINNVNEEFATRILNELGFPTYSKELKISKRHLIHILRDFFLSRGNENSFKFLFQIFFDSDVEIDYPRKYLIKTSSTPFGGKTYIFTTGNNTNSAFFKKLVSDKEIQNNTTIKGLKSLSQTNIDFLTEFETKDKRIFQICILPNNSPFLVDEPIEFSYESYKFVEQILPIGKLTIINGGTNYNEGDLISVKSNNQIFPGYYTVTRTKKDGIVSITIENGGVNYSVGDIVYAIKNPLEKGAGFLAEVVKVNQTTGTIEEIEILNSGWNYEKIPQLEVKSKTGNGAKLSVNTNTIGGILEIKAIHPIILETNNFSQVQIEFINNTSGHGAQLSLSSTDRYEEIKKFLSNNSVLGRNCIITDSNLFQQFSYELISKVSSEEYKALIEMIHPTGFMRFDVLRHENNEHLNISQLNSYLKKSKNIIESLLLSQSEIQQMISISTILKIYSKTKRINSLSINTLDEYKFSDKLDFYPIQYKYPVIKSILENSFMLEAFNSNITIKQI